MENRTRLRIVTALQKIVLAAMLSVWLYLVYSFASSELPMIRQMLGCMASTMIIFGLLSLGNKMLARYKERLEEGV